MPTDNVLIVDFGSQTTQLIARRVRELNVYCEIHPCTASFEKLRAFDPGAVILSGGPASVYDDGAPTVDPAIFELGVPVLGICYGMQLTAHLLGGKVQPSNHREFGQAKVTLDRSAASKLLGRLASETEVEVWMSHGDQVLALPAGFVSVGKTSSTPNAVVANPERRIFGLQFHPEVVHTPKGLDLLAAFLFDVAGLSATWTPDTFVQDSIDHIKHQVGDGHAICGLSGGVDSTVAAVLVERAIKERLTCVFVDHGLMRLNEGKEVVQMFKEHVPSLKLIAVDAKARFMSELDGVTDPETKRKIIGRVFIEVFEAEAKKISGTTHLVQGTLYPDVIESVSFKGPSVTIKSHHNVGGLPERMNLKLCEPLRELFKDEVRAAGEILGIPRHVLYRHPFPGPGLAIRCLGELAESRLDTLRHADAIFIEELKKQNLYDSVWQAFCVLLPVRTVGVMGDGRTYDEVLALRAVSSRDGMTADWSRLPHEFLAQVSLRITNEVRGINRVVLDISGKPPATIEWE